MHKGLGLWLITYTLTFSPPTLNLFTFSPSQGPEHCNECRNYYVEEMLGEGPLMRVCVEVCPLGTFLNTSSRQCVPCHDGCQMQAGCAGPLPYVNRTHGCLECDRVQLDREERQVSISNCLPAPFYTQQSHNKYNEYSTRCIHVLI